MERTTRLARKRVQKPARRWFQLHLSTALLLMFGAGVLMSLNLQQRTTTYSLVQPPASTRPETTFHVRVVSHGWPFWTDAQFTRTEADGSDFAGYTDFATSTALFKLVRTQLGIPESPDPSRSVNGGIAAALLLVLSVVSEFLIRRRKPTVRAGAAVLPPVLPVNARDNHVAESSAQPGIDQAKS